MDELRLRHIGRKWPDLTAEETAQLLAEVYRLRAPARAPIVGAGAVVGQEGILHFTGWRFGSQPDRETTVAGWTLDELASIAADLGSLPDAT